MSVRVWYCLYVWGQEVTCKVNGRTRGCAPTGESEMFGGISGTVVVSSLIINGVAGAQANESEAKFFVSTDGDDGWSGKLEAPNAEKTDGPFATIARARDAIHEMKVDGGLSGPVNVMVRGGTHFLEETIVFGPDDSGGLGCRLWWNSGRR